MSDPLKDWMIGQLDNCASDAKNFANSARYCVESGQYNKAAEFARRAEEAANDAAMFARDVVRECDARPPHKCECCAEAVPTVDEHRACPSCAALDADGRAEKIREAIRKGQAA